MNPPMTAIEARDVATTVAGIAGSALLEGWGRVAEVRSKGYATDLVTEWDTKDREAADRRRASGCRTPGCRDPRLGSGGAHAGFHYVTVRWVVDPVDGTVNFAHGLPLFAISIGYEVGGVAEAGCVIAPALGWTFAAARGAGATKNGEPIHASGVGDLGRALLATGFPYDRREKPCAITSPPGSMKRTAGACRRLGAASLDLRRLSALRLARRLLGDSSSRPGTSPRGPSSSRKPAAGRARAREKKKEKKKKKRESERAPPRVTGALRRALRSPKHGGDRFGTERKIQKRAHVGGGAKTAEAELAGLT